MRPALLIALIGGTAITISAASCSGPAPTGIASRALTSFQPTFAPRILKLWRRSAGPPRIFPGQYRGSRPVPAVLLASLARLWPVTNPQQGLVPAQLYFSATWGSQQTAIVKGRHIDYLYVDTRLTDSLPMLGYYISEGETPKPTRITEADVAKFAHVPGLKAVYHHGPVTIYDTSGLGVAPKRAGFTGYHRWA